MRASLAALPHVHLMYVAEIIPPAATAVATFESKYVEEGLGFGQQGVHSFLGWETKRY